MSPTDKPVSGPLNEPMMPVAWIKTFTGKSGKPARVFTTTMGASQDLLSEGTRRMLVNACYWAVGIEQEYREERRDDRRRLHAPALRLRRTQEGCQAV